RYQIQALVVSKAPIREMARILGRSPSTISREIRRNRPNGILYRASKACHRAQRKRAGLHPRHKISGSIRAYVEEKLILGWSPEQIAGRLALDGTSVTHETIYQFVFRNFREDAGNLYRHLPRKRKRRRSQLSHKRYVLAGKRLDLPWIDSRPQLVEARTRLGDYERDSIVGPRRQGSALLTIVDRKSRLTKLGKLQTLGSNDAHKLTVRLLRGLPLNTITNDNGPEFSMFDSTSKQLKIPIYFSKLYCSWQRGTNKNTNGLVRRFFPKGTNFNDVTSEEIRKVEALLNSRPRKCLGFRTPLEVQNDQVGCCIGFLNSSDRQSKAPSSHNR
ncbi:MAG: IS30 family transposase, partial [Deltaproteobacteria bacterium]|nr:IS30 family transposase [Deltaproteobacteria bacterium]